MEERSEMDRYLNELIAILYADLNQEVIQDDIKQTTSTSTGEDLDLSCVYGPGYTRRSIRK